MPDIESELCIKHANMIVELEKKLADDPEPAAVVNDYFRERMQLHLTSLNPKNSRPVYGRYSGHTCTCLILKPQTKPTTCVSTADPFCTETNCYPGVL